jgi:hypothetical protein
MLDARYWMLDAGCSMLDARYWMLDARYWMLDAGCWIRPPIRRESSIENRDPFGHFHTRSAREFRIPNS